MAQTIVIGSTEENAGRKLFIWALSQRAREKGLQVGLFRPRFSSRELGGSSQPEEVLLLKEAMGIGEPLEALAPEIPLERPVPNEDPTELARRIQPHWRKVCEGKDLLLVMGARHVFLDDSSSMVSDIALARALDGHFLLVVKFQDIPRTLYSILNVLSLLGGRLGGVVVNRIPHGEMDEVRRHVSTRVPLGSVPPIFFIPEDPFLAYRTLGDVVRLTGGELLFGSEYLDRLVGGWTIGGSELLSGELSPLKRLYNRVLLLAPQEPDSEVRGDVAAIVSTSGRRPPQALMELAEKRRLPLFVIQEDALSLLDKLDKVPPSLTSKDHAKASRMLFLLEKSGPLEAIFQGLGLARR
jgi:BioD-like phosphotransacetylase family protein